MVDRRDPIGEGKANAETRNYALSDESLTTVRNVLMGWSDRQSHILTGGGISSELYQAPQFPFSEEELPHFHKGRGTTHQAFAAWHRQVTIETQGGFTILQQQLCDHGASFSRQDEDSICSC